MLGLPVFESHLRITQQACSCHKATASTVSQQTLVGVVVTPSPQLCRVGFLSHLSRAAALPPTLTGDILEDLPPVDNFCLADSTQYA